MNVFQRQLVLGSGRTLAEERNARGGSIPLAPPPQRIPIEEFSTPSGKPLGKRRGAKQ